jgi:hypothetical protein
MTIRKVLVLMLSSVILVTTSAFLAASFVLYVLTSY